MLFLASCSGGFVRKLGGGGGLEFSAWQYPCGEWDIMGVASADLGRLTPGSQQPQWVPRCRGPCRHASFLH